MNITSRHLVIRPNIPMSINKFNFFTSFSIFTNVLILFWIREAISVEVVQDLLCKVILSLVSFLLCSSGLIFLYMHFFQKEKTEK